MCSFLEVIRKNYKKCLTYCRKCYSSFRTKYPQDNRSRKAGQTWIQREISVSDARKAAFAAHTTAREADNHARAAKQATAYSAHVVATRYTHLHTQ